MKYMKITDLEPGDIIKFKTNDRTKHWGSEFLFLAEKYNAMIDKIITNEGRWFYELGFHFLTGNDKIMYLKVRFESMVIDKSLERPFDIVNLVNE